MNKWTDRNSFPDPRNFGFLNAPIGPGVYEVRRIDTQERILFGQGKNCAYRMSSLLSKPYGAGTRNNQEKRITYLKI
ncbi:MAG TPA: hypothetical protein VE912_22070 [Bacteroidales bacterium]|nr:hypothetical protein [Bacteroidales bacterium]